MTQEKINKCFNTPLGEQCDVLYTTADDKIFIRHEEAVKHSTDNNLDVNAIAEWFREDEYPTPQQEANAIESAIEQLLHDHPEFYEENTTGWDMIRTLEFIRIKYQNEIK
jgi:hypothetical protein